MIRFMHRSDLVNVHFTSVKAHVLINWSLVAVVFFFTHKNFGFSLDFILKSTLFFKGNFKRIFFQLGKTLINLTFFPPYNK